MENDPIDPSILTQLRHHAHTRLEDCVFSPEEHEYYYDILTQTQISTYLFLDWLDTHYHPKRLLYPAVGYDRLPQLVFTDRLLHTSIEHYGKLDDLRYATDLKANELIICDNAHLPLASASFDALLLQDNCHQLIFPYLDDFLRLLKPGGLIALTSTYFTDDCDYQRPLVFSQLPGVTKLPIPGDLLPNRAVTPYLFQKSAR